MEIRSAVTVATILCLATVFAVMRVTSTHHSQAPIQIVSAAGDRLDDFFSGIPVHERFSKSRQNKARKQLPSCQARPTQMDKVAANLGLNTTVSAQNCSSGACTGCGASIDSMECGDSCYGGSYSVVTTGLLYEPYGFNSNGSNGCAGNCNCVFQYCYNSGCEATP